MMKFITMLFVAICSIGYAETIKVKKSDVKPEDLKHIRAKKSDNEYYYVELTAEELKIVTEARKAFAEGRKLPPPSKNMINKMQDQIAPVNESK